MHSSWKIWDFFQNYSSVFNDRDKPIIAIQAFDDFALKLIKTKILDTSNETVNFNIQNGKQIKTTWIEDNLMSLGLFGNDESYLIINANEMSKDCKTLLLETDRLILDTSFLMFFFLKDDELIRKYKKMKNANVITVQAPAFWEYDKMLDFMCEQKNILLSYEAKSYILQNVSPEISLYYNLLEQLSINLEENVNLSLSQIEPFIQKSKIDQFEFAALFGSKKIRDFYQKLIELEDYNDLRQVSMFMQSHLMKVYDPSYLQSKAKHSKYDRQIESQSMTWSKDGLSKAINYFSELEIMAKGKQPMLHSRIKKDYLRMTF